MSPATNQEQADATLQVRLDVAEMKGMLTMALQNHGERILGLEADRDKINTRLNEKARRLAITEAELKDTRQDVTQLQARADGQFGKSLQTLVATVAAGGLVLSLLQAAGALPTG